MGEKYKRMNGVVKNIIAEIAYLLPFNMLHRRAYPAVIPLYHVVAEQQPDYISQYTVKTPRQFERDLDFLLKYFKPASLGELLNIRNGKNDIFHLTFDDGLKSCIRIIAPILKRKGIPATFFINPAFVDKDEVFHRFLFEMLRESGVAMSNEMQLYPKKDYLETLAHAHGIRPETLLKRYNPYMNFEDIRQLHSDGFTIGGHSMDHPEFYQIDETEQFRQVKTSMQWVISNFNPGIKAFAFPFTDSGIQNNLLKRIERENLADITFGTAGLKHDSFQTHLQRIPMENVKYRHAAHILKFEYFYYFLRGIFYKNTVLRHDS